MRYGVFYTILYLVYIKPFFIILNIEQPSTINIIMIKIIDSGDNRIQMKEGGSNHFGADQSIAGTGGDYPDGTGAAAPCHALQRERMGAGDFRALSAATGGIGGDLFHLYGLSAGRRAHRERRGGGPHTKGCGAGEAPDFLSPGEEPRA